MNKTIKYTLLFAALLGTALAAGAQTAKDSLIFRAMRDEIGRTMRLSLPGQQTPFYVGYYYVVSTQFRQTATLGAVTSSSYDPVRPVGGVKMLLGDSAMTSDPAYMIRMRPLAMPIDTDYDLIRMRYWLQSDAEYKNALNELAEKQAVAQTMSVADRALDDWTRVPPMTRYVDRRESPDFDAAAWEVKLRELSAIFLNYPDIYNSVVELVGFSADIYLQTSDSITVRRPTQSVALLARGMMKAGSQPVAYDCQFVAGSPDQLPSLEEMKARITAKADEMLEFRNAAPAQEYYIGPVLFEGGFLGTYLDLFACSLVLPSRKDGNVSQMGEVPLYDRIGTRILDPRITLTNHNDMTQYKGMPVYGALEVDAEGVATVPATTLIEKGIYRGMLSNRVPKRGIDHSTGNMKFNISMTFAVAPSALHFRIDGGVAPEKLKKELIAAAKRDGLGYAYIVRGMNDVWRVDVKTGRETPVVNALLGRFSLENFRLLQASDRETVSTRFLGMQELSSIIHPTALILDSYEIIAGDERKQTDHSLGNPLQAAVK